MNKFMEFLKTLLKEDADVSLIQSNLTACIEEENQEKTSGLIENRNKIKDEKLKLQKDLDEASNKLSFYIDQNITPETYGDMIAELDSARASGDSKEELDEKFKAKYESGKKAAETALSPKLITLERQIEVLTKDKEKAEQLLKDFRAEAEIRKAVSATGIEATPTWMRGLFAASKVEFDDYGHMSIELPLEDQGTIPIDDWKKAFKETKEAKRMMPARLDNGGSALGGKTGASDEPETVEDMYKSFFN